VLVVIALGGHAALLALGVAVFAVIALGGHVALLAPVVAALVFALGRGVALLALIAVAIVLALSREIAPLTVAAAAAIMGAGLRVIADAIPGEASRQAVLVRARATCGNATPADRERGQAGHCYEHKGYQEQPGGRQARPA
jgi:hypothetical protein